MTWEGDTAIVGAACRHQAKGLIYTSPGQRPGNMDNMILLQANGLQHT